jgi:xanthine/CO dehydrogenase XdhC/CoxF family maturation factor
MVRASAGSATRRWTRSSGARFAGSSTRAGHGSWRCGGTRSSSSPRRSFRHDGWRSSALLRWRKPEGIGREERFPDATVIRAWPEDGLPAAGLDRYLSVAAIAHDPKVDLPALAAALRAGCRYVGLLGGRRTQRLRREALLEMGLSEEQVARVRGPIGLDIGAVEPREIALAIAAELLSLHSPGVPET